jgi:hypothetical protein
MLKIYIKQECELKEIGVSYLKKFKPTINQVLALDFSLLCCPLFLSGGFLHALWFPPPIKLTTMI